MIKANKKMVNFLRNVNVDTDITLPELEDILIKGFKDFDGCFFLNERLKKYQKIQVDNYFDRTECECFVNEISVNSIDDGSHIGKTLFFVNKILQQWIEKGPKFGVFNVILILDDEKNVTIKCHLKRQNEELLCENLDEYEEYILVVDTEIGSNFIDSLHTFLSV